MDNLTSSVGQLSTSAKEWKPGQGYSTPTKSNSPAPSKKGKNQFASGGGQYTEFHPRTPPLASKSDGTGTSDGGGNDGAAVVAQPSPQTTANSNGGTELKVWNPDTTKEFIPQSAHQHQNFAQDQKLLPSQAAKKNHWFGDAQYEYHQDSQHSHLPTQESDQSANANASNQQRFNYDDTASASVPSGPIPTPINSTYTSNSAITPPIPRSLHSLGLPTPTLWSLYRNISLDCNREMNPTDQRYKAIPSFFGKAMPLEQSIDTSSSSHQQIPHPQQQNYSHASQINQSQNLNANANRSSFGYPTAVFKVTSRQDGRLYCLRRFDSVKCVNQQIATTVTSTWSHAATNTTTTPLPGNNNTPNPTSTKPLTEHPALVTFYRCFHSPTHRALFFVHRYHPSALTLREHVHGWARGTSGTGGVLHTKTQQRRRNGGFPPLVEETIWSYATQLASGVRAVHRAGLACRVLSLGHILVTPEVGSGSANGSVVGGDESTTEIRTNRVRLRINCLGVADALEYEARKQIPDLQKRDMRALGRILLSLASGTEIGGEDSTGSYDAGDVETLGRCDAFLRRNYSRELRNLILALVAPQTNSNRLGPQQSMGVPPNIEELCRALASKAMDEMDSAHAVVDGMDEVLGMEFESGRALRLLLKMGCVNERPEFGVDRRWSETGDCYVLKLFRDYVFHQADAAGRPVLDLGHMVTALNKLDASDEEKIVLTSRDGKSIMVVSYADVARCLQNAYAELCNTSVPHQHMRLLDDGGGNVGSGTSGY